MPTVSPLPVNPAVLTWAREESGYPVARLAERLQVKADRVQAWERGVRPPTLRQVQELSRFYHRPLSVFFLAAPPQVPPPAAEYRRLPGVVPGQESPELRLAVRRMSSRRENALNLMEELGEPVVPFALSARLNRNGPGKHHFVKLVPKKPSNAHGQCNMIRYTLNFALLPRNTPERKTRAGLWA